MRRSPFPALSLPPVLAITAVCVRCVASGGTEPNPVDIGGTWSFVEEFTDLDHHITCADTGTYVITQSASGFAGSYTQRGACALPAGLVDNSDSGAVTDGRVVGRTVRFKAPNCEYDGRVLIENMDRLTGHVACEIGDQQVTYSFAGTWSAVR
jgi:hypothetical protein